MVVFTGRGARQRPFCTVAPPPAVWQQVTPNLFAMIVVVAFSSCLDVAAIEMEMGTPLDFNGELQTVRRLAGFGVAAGRCGAFFATAVW